MVSVGQVVGLAAISTIVALSGAIFTTVDVGLNAAAEGNMQLAGSAIVVLVLVAMAAAILSVAN